MKRAGCALVAFSLGLLGCGKTSTPISTHGASGASSSAGTEAIAGAGVANDGAGGESAEPPLTCTGLHPGPKPLLRWSNDALNRALAALMDKTNGSVSLPTLVGSNDRAAAPYTRADVTALHGWAHDVAERLSADAAALAALSGCKASELDTTTCRDRFIDGFGARAWRHALSDADRAELVAVFDDGQQLQPGFGGGARAVVEVALQSPDFLYLLELGDGRRNGEGVALSGFESAARLAYFLTGSLPDDELSAAASQGELDEATLERHALRLMGTSQYRQRFLSFYAQLLGFEPTDETRQFVEKAAFSGDASYRSLLSAPAANNRSGLLTQPAFLRAKAYSDTTSPSGRGRAVLEQLLCQALPPSPHDVPTHSPKPPLDATTRETLTQLTANPACQACHRDMDAAGFAFEHYDELGKYRTLEHDKLVDSSGELALPGAEGHFDDAVQLETLVADSPAGRACFVSQWLAQAYGRSPFPLDDCSQSRAAAAFEASDGKLVDTLLAIIETDGFRYRLSSELAP